ncbi:MAG: hypothetical protein K0R57_4422 [Paenibacillaceae bacterium]|jgi:multiple sugar transport system permease protein|nr:hypothetical protein [Paenibacillaceae bacterium]
MKSKGNRIREQGQTGFTLVTYSVTILFILLSLVPLAWAFSSSLKDALSLFKMPPDWIPAKPQSIVLTLDYSQAGDTGREAMEQDALKAMWFSWKKHQNQPIGEMTVTGVAGGKALYRAEMKSYEFNAGKNQVVPTQLFTDQIMKTKYPLIKAGGFSHFEWYGGETERPVQEGRTAPEADGLAGSIVSFLEQSDFMTGKVTAASQSGNWWRVFDNYLAVIKGTSFFSDSISIWTYLYNSAFVTGMTIVTQLVFGGLTAYAITKMMTGKWSARFTLFFVATLFIPEIAVIVPLYLVIEKLNLTNNLWGVILPHTSWGLVIFIFKGFFGQLPDELLQAARIDGANEWKIFYRIVVPMSVPVFTVVAVMTFMPVWNEFLWPLIVLRDDHLWTFSVYMSSRTNSDVSDTNLTMAMLLIATLPLLLVFASCQRLIEKGISWSGVKG